MPHFLSKDAPHLEGQVTTWTIGETSVEGAGTGPLSTGFLGRVSRAPAEPQTGPGQERWGLSSSLQAQLGQIWLLTEFSFPLWESEALSQQPRRPKKCWQRESF